MSATTPDPPLSLAVAVTRLKICLANPDSPGDAHDNAAHAVCAAFDAEASRLDAIHALLTNGDEWEAETTDAIADILRAAGYEINDINDD